MSIIIQRVTCYGDCLSLVFDAGYGSGLNYNSGIGSGMYGSSYGGGLGSYGGGGLYGNGMYRGGYGGLYGNSGIYGGGMYGGGLGGGLGGGFGSPMGGGYGMGMGPYGEQDPNNPFGAPPSPPGFWISFLRVVIPFSSCHSFNLYLVNDICHIKFPIIAVMVAHHLSC